MLRHTDIAKSLLIEAHTDLDSARILLQAGIYARSLAHSQHTVEKILKAALTTRHIIITDRHDVSEDFGNTFSNLLDIERILEIASEMETIGSKTEYPLFGRRDLPIWIPSEEITQQHAEIALANANYVFETLKRYLVEEHNIQV